MGKIWTPDDWEPEQLTPDGWDPDEWFEVNSWSPEREETIVVKATILRADYFPDREVMIVHVRKEDGQDAAVPIPKSAYKFRGKHHMDLPKEETDREMAKTAAAYAKAKGRRINLRVYKT